ncbi:MAG: ATP synthase F1 subunit delta [Clostridiaceae bacterium]|jgi:F-type H+-transporting ATPase subunit delta|nr:ATP synthase F1 subunit delta [Clostridiaceae bacterium]
MPLVECRYAEALIEITEENCSTDEVLTQFNELINIFESNPELEGYLKNPSIQLEEKKRLLGKVFEGLGNESFLRFLYLLMDKDRIKYIKGILIEYKRLVDKKRNILNLKISSAVQLDELQIKKIEEKYAQIYKNDTVSSVVEIDKSLIGGIKVQIGDRVEDYSVKSRLDSLKNLLTER